MKVEVLDNHAVKVVLSRRDMANLKLSYADIGDENPTAKRTIINLLKNIKDDFPEDGAALNLNSSRLYIEAFPYADGGCILYVTVVGDLLSSVEKPISAFDAPLIFEFAKINPLCELSRGLSASFSHIITKSALYLLNKKYYLVLYSFCKLNSRIIGFCCEYGSFYGKGAVKCALVREHGKELIAADAVSVMAAI